MSVNRASMKDMFLKPVPGITLRQIILFTFVVRCLVALMVNLGNDEVYYFTYAVQPDWNHFDHPPLVGLFIRLFTLNLHWINGLSIRLPSIAGAAINTWLIAKCGQKLKDRTTGLIAAILYNTSIYSSIISGLFILPDSVQIVFWLAALYTMILIVDSDSDRDRNTNLLLLGFWIGLATMSKVHGLFLWLGFFGFVLTNQRTWLKNPVLYLAVLVTTIIISPILLWNYENNFISWQFQSERVLIDDGINLVSFGSTIAGQIGYNNPFNIALIILSVFGLIRQKNLLPASKLYLLFWCGLPIISATTLVSLFRMTLPHWSGPGFLALILLTSCYLSTENRYLNSGIVIRLFNSAIGFTLLVIAAGVVTINYYPGTFSTKTGSYQGEGDPTLDMYGWDQVLPLFKKIRINDIRRGLMRKDSPLVLHKWFPGSHLYFYVAYPLGLKVVGLGPVNDLHKFTWLNDVHGAIQQGSDAYFIIPTNNFADPGKIYQNQFESIELAYKIPSLRKGKLTRFWYVYRLKSATKELPTGH